MKKNHKFSSRCHAVTLSRFCILLSAFCFLSCSGILAKDIKGDGKLVTQSVNISNFSKVEIETYVEVNYSQEKNTGKLEFTVDGNLWEYYDIHTKGDVLRIKLKEEYRNNIQPKPTKSVITVSSGQLESIEIAGSSRFNICTGFTSEELKIELAGSGKVIADKNSVKIKNCDIEIAGSGGVQFAGDIQYASIEIAGSGSVDALNCVFEKAKIEIAGSGTVEATVTDLLDVEIAGSGKVNFKGEPKISTDIAGTGKVTKL